MTRSMTVTRVAAVMMVTTLPVLVLVSNNTAASARDHTRMIRNSPTPTPDMAWSGKLF